MIKQNIKKRAFDIIMGHPPVNSRMLYAQLSVDYIDMSAQQIHEAVSDLVREKIIIELRYNCLSNAGSLFFPPETEFVLPQD